MGKIRKGLGFGGQLTEVTSQQEEWTVDIKYNPEGEARNRYESYSKCSPVDTNTPRVREDEKKPTTSE